MYIRKSQQKHAKTGEVYINYRLVESYRNAEGKVRQQTLLNLGSQFSTPQTEWKILVGRIEAIRYGQNPLFSLDHILEKEAERIAKLLIKKSSEQSSPLHLIPQFLMLDFSLGRITAAYHGIYNQASCCWIPWSSNGSSMFSKIKH